MKVKEGVSLEGLKIEMRKVLVSADRVWRNNGEEVVVTETVEGVHSAGSLHYYGYAVDLRSRYFDIKTKKKVVKELIHALPAGYDVVLEKTHIHVEYDAAK